MAASQHAQQRGVDRRREPAGRYDHSTAVINNSQLFSWGGYQDGMPRVHDSTEKRQFFSYVEVFDVNTGCWEQRTTRGTPPLGVQGYSCVAVRNDLHYFGGECSHSNCYHNSVHTLSTSTLHWRMLAPSTTESGAPMKKHHSGMVHFTDGEEDLLYVVGGRGHTAPSYGAQYKRTDFGDVLTDEQHIFSLSANGWSSPVVTGQAPPPCSSFTLTTVGVKRAAMFGGSSQSSYHNRASCYCDDLYIVDLERHAALPVVIGRYRHSVSAFCLGVHCVWLLVLGGYNELNSRADTSIIELIQDTSGQWCVERVMERETLSNNTEYQERLREASKPKDVSRQLQESESYQRKNRELQEENRVLNNQLQQVQKLHIQEKRQIEQENEETVRNILQQLTQEQTATRERENELAEKELKIQKLQEQLSFEQAKMKNLDNKVQYLQQQLMIVHEQAMNEEIESEEFKLIQQQLAEKSHQTVKLNEELTDERDTRKENESEIQVLRQKLTQKQRKVDELMLKLKEQEQDNTDMQQRMRGQEEELKKSKDDLECCQRKMREIKLEIKDRSLHAVTETDGINLQVHHNELKQNTMQPQLKRQTAPSAAALMVHVAKKIPTQWYQLGVLLQIDIATLDTFEAQTNDPVRLCIIVFEQWKKEEKLPFTWETIISVLAELKENNTATDLKKWLEVSS